MVQLCSGGDGVGLGRVFLYLVVRMWSLKMFLCFCSEKMGYIARNVSGYGVMNDVVMWL